MAVTFDGVNKQITVSGLADFDTVDVKVDIYGGWKEWTKIADNSKYLQALRPVGGDPIGGTQTVPPYFFLMNDWKVLVDAIQNLSFSANLYCEEATNINTNPYLISNNGSVISQTSDAPVNTIEVSTIAYSLELDGKIYLDVDTGSDSGTHLGTIAKPVLTLTKALSIATSENISTIMVDGTLILDQDVSGKEFISHKNGKIDFNNQLCLATRFRELKISGIQDVSSVALVFDCRIGNVSNLQGIFENCDFLNTSPITILGGTTLRRCTSQLIDDLVEFDLSLAGDLHLVDFIGNIQVNNGVVGSVVETYRHDGTLILDSSCVGGTYYITGDGQLIDNSGVGSVVDDQRSLRGLTATQDIQLQEVWRIMGLDVSNPMTVTNTARSTGTIAQTISGDGSTTTTVTRDP